MMKFEKKKELYANGDWICVCIGFQLKEWMITDNPEWISTGRYELIHKKHSEILGHVLKGGKFTHEFFDDVGGIDLFIKNYHENNEYKIIKDKPDLNKKFCYATEQHYKKLVEGGCTWEYEFLENYRYMLVKDNTISFWNVGLPIIAEPMHLHNNEWVMGSLEHEEDVEAVGFCMSEFYAEDESKPVNRITREQLILAKANGQTILVKDGEGKEWLNIEDTCCSLDLDLCLYKIDPKPVERITIEDAERIYNESIHKHNTYFVKKMFANLFDYIEYLEANQKEANNGE